MFALNYYSIMCVLCEEINLRQEGLIMPFKSKKQAAYLYAKKPEVAKEFADKTKDIKVLPKKIDVSKIKTKGY